jgi:antirestriction protein ArdC
MKDQYSKINASLISALENGENIWRKTWQSVKDCGMPHNLNTGNNYKGSNMILLGMQDVPCQAWVTFKGAKKLGGNVKKGAKSSKVFFWEFREVEDKKTGDKKIIPFLKVHSVFNAMRDCEGLEDKLKDKAPMGESNPSECLQDYLKRESITLSHGGNSAYYAPMQDSITMPHEQSFENSGYYNAVLAHEIIHSTGHNTRLNRLEKSAAFGSGSYAFEELVAEIGACYLCATMGIEPDFDQSAAYLKGWAKKLKENQNWFTSAGGKAQKALAFIEGSI